MSDRLEDLKSIADNIREEFKQNKQNKNYNIFYIKNKYLLKKIFYS